MNDTELVFTEFDASRMVHFAPVRNPLLEVRLFGFLRGDAYVNPFHDLLYALSRSSRPEKTAEQEPGLRRVQFADTGLSVSFPNATERTYPYASLQTLILSYAPTFTGEPAQFGFQYGTYLMQLTFTAGDESFGLPLKTSRVRFVELLDFLYARRVKFREFTHDMRSFRMDVNLSYRQVQEFKAKYDVEW
ncbi:hypothetical protein [Lewinella sp. IMCC34183]|uniref:hypothetical protein n=1 Tax=Lewinella sp. IMCC34183 TaxID=2248762 RepID=UPI000E263042|nr:hypothetical protein [Lewinella sp. IMCC34183]